MSKPLVPEEPPKAKGGRPRIPDQVPLRGMIFVLKSGLQWEMLPQKMDCGSGIICWRRVTDWQKAGVWKKLHKLLLDKLSDAGEIGWPEFTQFGNSTNQRCKKRRKLAARNRRIRENQARGAECAILLYADEEHHWP